MENYEREGEVAKAIEKETVKIPSDVFMWSAFAFMGVSLILKLSKKNNAALFVGQWPAPLLLFGIYNKIVKTQGSDRTDN